MLWSDALKRAIPGLMLMAGLLGMPALAQAQVSLTLGDATLAAGASGAVQATIATDGSAVALQFDVLYDPAVVSLGTVNGGAALTANHSIASNPISPGRDRVVITTSPVTALGGGTLATINLAIAGGAAAGTTVLSFDGVVISDAAAQPITPASLTPGTITITAAPVSPGTPPQAIPANPVWSLALLVALLLMLVRRHGMRLPALGSVAALSLLVLAPLTHAQGIPGDANGDGRIDAEDVRLIVERILERGVLPGDGDCNRDSTINVLDTVCSQLPFVPGETAPIILGPGDRSIPADTPFEMNLFAADPDAGATQSWALLSGPAGLAVSPAGVLTWTPGTGDAGPNPVSIRVTDDTVRTDEATFGINVFVLPAPPPENAPPQLTVPGNQSLPVGTPIAVQASATDPDAGDTLTFRLVNGPAGMSIDPDTGALAWTPQADQARTADVVIEVSDAAGAVDFGSFTVTATAPNGAPTAVDEVFEARVGETLRVEAAGVLGNDTDPNGDALTAILVTDVAQGDLDLQSDGSFTYLLEPSEAAGAVELELWCRNSLAEGSNFQGNGTPAVGDVDNDGTLEVVGTGFISGLTFIDEVWIMNAEDCSQQFATGSVVEAAGGFENQSHVGLLDIDGDGDLEIIAPRGRYPANEGGLGDGSHLLAIHHDGSFAWGGNHATETSTVIIGNADYWRGGPTFSDIDADGTPEIIMAFSNGVPGGAVSGLVVYNAEDGSIQWEFLSSVVHSDGPLQKMPYVADLDLDGTMEVIVHNSVVDHEGNLEFELPLGSPTAGHLFLGIANFDDDPFPELIGRDREFHYLFEHDGTLAWQQVLPKVAQSQISVADFDGDGAPEFAYITCTLNVAFGSCSWQGMAVYDTDGSLLWEHENDPDLRIPVSLAASVNPMAFDANGDGAFDLVYRNDSLSVRKLFIVNGRDGTLLHSVRAWNYTGTQRYPVIADINGDGHAEIINTYTGGIQGETEIWTGTAGNPLPYAPPLRHQWNFLEAYVDDDVTVTSNPVPHWLRTGSNGWNLVTPEPPGRASRVDLQLECEHSRVKDPNNEFQANGTVAIGDVDNDGDVELVGIFPVDGSATIGDLWMFDAETCTEQRLISIEADGGFWNSSHPGLLDIDGDGDLEIIATRMFFPAAEGGGFDGKHLVAVHHDGTLAWSGDGGSESVPALESYSLGNLWRYAGPTFADLDGDGTAEIVMAFHEGINTTVFAGLAVFNAGDGSLAWEFQSNIRVGNGANQRTPKVVDLDLDGTMEIILQGEVLSHEGEVEFVFPSPATEGSTTWAYLMTAVGNFDDDPFPEVIGRDEFAYYLYNHDGSIIWTVEARNRVESEITVADFDGDGELEFAEVGCRPLPAGSCPGNFFLRVFDGDGSLLWSHEGVRTLEVERLYAPFAYITAFDANRDGAFDLVWQNDDPLNNRIYIVNGRDGSVLEAIEAGSIGNQTRHRFVSVADVDRDGEAELITSNTGGIVGETRIWGGKTATPLPSARPFRHQWLFQEAYVSADGKRTVANPVPHWLQPGRNGWNLLTPEPDPGVGTRQTFTYRANDGALDSNLATVTLDILPPGNPPLFLSDPPTRTTRGMPYAYEPIVVDPDLGDTVTFRLTAGPEGMSLDPATGAIDWLPPTIGLFEVSILALDTIGFAQAQSWELEVGESVRVPDVVGLAEAAAETALLDADLGKGQVLAASSATVPAGQVLQQSPPAGAIAGFGSAVALTLSDGPAPLDRDDDGDGYSENQGDCNDADDAIFPGAADTDGDGIDQDCDGIDGNKTLVSIEVSPAERRVLTGQPVPLIATGIFDDGTAQNLTAIASWTRGPTFVSNTAGDFTAVANFRGVTGSADFEVVARVDDDVAPIARITAPASGNVVTAPTDVVGTAQDSNLLRYEVAYRAVDDTNWTVLAEETSNRIQSPIGTFDPSLLLNGFYEIRLRVFDRGGNVSEDTTTVRVDGQLKVGNFTLRYVDLELPFNGIPITIARSYDSRDKRAGDFGVGWRLGVNSIEVRSSRELGTGWRVNRQGLTYSLAETDPHLVAVRFPGGEIEAFRMVVTPEVSPIVPFPPFSQSVRFEALPGTLGTLESLEANNVSILDAQPGTARLRLDSNGDIYNPTLFRYRSPDGVIVDVDIVDGIQRAETPGGQVLTFSAGSIRHSNGREVQLDRDAVGRITRITDPEGFSQVYSYDANGDLRSHEDQEGFVTRFDYDGSHNIIRIFDPLGRPVARNEYDAAGRLIRNTNVDGGVTEFDHDVVGRQEVITNPDGSTTVMEFDDRGNVLRYTDALGNTTTNTYDERNNQLTTTNALGETITRTFDEHNNLLTETDPLGNTKRYEYDSRDKLIRFTDALGRVATFAFDARGNLLEQSDPLGNTVSYEYDSNGNLVNIENARGERQRFSYDAFGNQLSMTDARGNTERFSYNANGEPVSSTTRRGITVTVNLDGRGLPTDGTDPVGRTMSFVFGATRALSEVTDPAGNTTVFATDADDKEVAYTDPVGNRTEKRYDPRGQLTELEDPAGNTTLFAYDDVERPVRTTLPDGAQTQTRYDAAGRVSEVEDALGNVTRYAYDAAGRNTRVTDALGNVTEYAYDAAGQLVAMTDARGEVFEYHYDGAGRRIRTLYPEGSFTETGYDELGQVISETDALGRVTQYRYDANGNLVRVTDPLGGTTNFLYDADDQLIARLDALGHRTSFRYDDFGRLVEMVYPDGSRETRSYDAAGNIASETDPNGRTTTYEYDADGRIVRKAFGDGTEEQFTYRHTDQILTATNAHGTVRHEYDGNDRLIRLENPDGSSIAYTYDGLGNRLTETLRASAAGSAATTTYTYDALNRIETVTDPQGRVVRYSYDAVGNLASLVYPNGVTSTYSYDANNRLRELRHATGSGDIARYVYDVNAVGDRTRVTNTVDGTFVDYAYDELRRLTRETHYNVAAVATFELRYSYDAVGNRTAQVDLSGFTTLFNYDSADKLISAGSVLFAYDANGNQIERRAGSAVTRYRFDAEDQLTNVQAPGADVSFAYDANGARIRRAAGAVTNYLVDPENGTGFSQVVGEYTGDELQTQYVYGDRILSRQEGADALYYHADANHNVRVLTGSSGTERDRYSYTAFGATLAVSSGSANVYGFASERTDSLVGLSYLRARYYDPSTGRFLSRDPYAGELRDPVSLHRYLYAHANPVAFRDPSGRVTFAEVKVTAAIGATMGALTSGLAAYAAGKRGYQIVAEMFIGAAFGAVGGAVGPALSTAFAKSRVIFSLLSNPVVAKYGARLVYAIPVTVLGLVEDLSKGLSSGDIANRGYFRDLFLVTGANLLFNTLVGPGVVEAKEVRTLLSTAAPTGREVVSNGRQLYQIVRDASVAARRTRLATTITEFRLYAPARLTAPMEALMKFIYETTKTIVAVVPGYANPRP